MEILRAYFTILMAYFCLIIGRRLVWREVVHTIYSEVVLVRDESPIIMWQVIQDRSSGMAVLEVYLSVGGPLWTEAILVHLTLILKVAQETGPGQSIILLTFSGVSKARFGNIIAMRIRN